MCFGDWLCRCNSDTTNTSGYPPFSSYDNVQLKDDTASTPSLSELLNLVYLILKNDEIIGWTNDITIAEKWKEVGYEMKTLNNIGSAPPEVTVKKKFIEDIYEFMEKVNVVNDTKGRYISLMSKLEDILNIGEDEGNSE